MLTSSGMYLRWGLYMASFLLAVWLTNLTKNKDYILAWVIGLIGFVNVEVMYILAHTPATQDVIQRAYTKCYVECDHPVCQTLTSLRGEGYFLTQEEDSKRLHRVKHCMLSLWGVLHFILFAIIGFVAPTILPAIIVVSVVYELAEWQLYQCHDAIDVVLNVVGYITGMALRYMVL